METNRAQLLGQYCSNQETSATCEAFIDRCIEQQEADPQRSSYELSLEGKEEKLTCSSFDICVRLARRASASGYRPGSLLKIGAANEEILAFVRSSELSSFEKEVPALVDRAIRIGLNKEEILAFLAASADHYERFRLSSRYLWMEGLLTKAFADPTPTNSLRALGFSNLQIVGFFRRYKELKDVDVGALKELLALGLSPQQVIDDVVKVQRVSPALSAALRALCNAGFSITDAADLVIGKRGEIKLPQEFLAQTVIGMSAFGKMKPSAIRQFLLDLPKISADKNTAFIIKGCLSFGRKCWYRSAYDQVCTQHGWKPETIRELLLFLTGITENLSTEEALKVSSELVEVLESDALNAGDRPPDLADVLRDLLPRVRSTLSPKNLENYLLQLFSLAAIRKDADAIRQVAAEAAAHKDAGRQLQILAGLATQKAYTIELVKNTPYAQVARINGITLILPEAFPANPLLIPGIARFEKKRVVVKNFNRKQITAVFEYPAKNIEAAKDLLEATDVLPGEFFTSFKTGEPLQILFRTDREGDYGGLYWGNQVTINTPGACSLSTIVHELAHHWDMNLTVGYDGEQDSAGDLSALHYGISWTPEQGGPEEGAAHRSEKVPEEKGPDAGDFARDYGLTNFFEDLATMVQHYVTLSASLRNHIRENMKKGNFELAVKYLFVKHMTPFVGREYELSEKNPGLTFEEVDAAIAAAKDTSATAPATFATLAEIKVRAKLAGF